MSQKLKKKLCWNCEGRASFEAENCPYCGVYLRPLSITGHEGNEHLFAPPYRLNASGDKQETPAAPYATEGEGDEDDDDEDTEETGEDEDEEDRSLSSSSQSGNDDDSAESEANLKQQFVGTVLPIGLFVSGSLFLLFSLALFFFSDESGRLTLQWNNAYWPMYLGLSVPMLIFGWKKLA